MKSIHKILLVLILIAFVGGGLFFTYAYNQVYGVNVQDNPEGQHVFYIKSNDDYEEVLNNLLDQGILLDKVSFERIAHKMNYPNKVISGKYRIQNGMNNRSLVNLLRSGSSEEVKVVVNATRDLRKICAEVGKKLEADSTRLYEMLQDETFLSSINLDRKTLPVLFATDTYNFRWSSTEKQFIERMQKEHEKFWSDERKQKAKELNLTVNEVVTLASIVEEETYHNDEMAKVAGVYLNRLEKNWLLQADPTVKFAVGDFEIKRVLDKHLTTDSPYNTYMYEGLPPGPICIPSKEAIDAVLEDQKHDYFFFCANDDFSMYHVFAKSLKDHMINARRYQRALNRKKIF